MSAEEFLKTHKASFTNNLQATTRLAQDACMMPGHNGQMSLIKTHEAMPGGVEIRFVYWSINGHRRRLVSLDASNKPIWTTNSKCQELGLTDATVIYPAVGPRCRQVRQELQPTIAWEVLHIKTMCSLVQGHLQCPYELCGQLAIADEATTTCPVCMMATHMTCMDNLLGKTGLRPSQLGHGNPTEIMATLTTIGIGDDICKKCLLSLGKLDVSIGHS